VRHPAFPKSVCAVVFQGQERSTGCQFTFTCDGALMRAISPAAWERARAVAAAALNGAVDKRVGHATHYHTDWVVPYWSSSLDKITEIRTHLFFRWTGWWGTPPAFNRRYAGAEPAIAKLARLSPAHAGAIDPSVLAAALAGEPAAMTPAALPSDLVVPPMAGGGASADTVLLTLDRRLSPTQFPALAARICGERTRCKLLAWSSKAATPAAQPLTDQQKDLMSFSYLRDRASGFERALWNCAEYKGLPAVQCMKPSMTMLPVQPALKYDATPGSVPRAITGQVASDGPPPVTRTRTAPPEPLAGVRRRIDAVPAPKATPTPAARE
jgi:hypothetical protein